jgi:hypothetical protein
VQAETTALATCDIALATRIAALPQELQDDILERLLNSTMPSDKAAVNIDHTRSPNKMPLALHVCCKHRDKYAVLYYRYGRFTIPEERNWTAASFAIRMSKWVSMVAPEQRSKIWWREQQQFVFCTWVCSWSLRSASTC